MVAFAFIIDIGEFGFLYNDSPLQMDKQKKKLSVRRNVLLAQYN